jgi:hypothetical protein
MKMLMVEMDCEQVTLVAAFDTLCNQITIH